MVYHYRTNWQLEPHCANDTLVLESVGLIIPVTHIYRRVRRGVGLEAPVPMQQNN
jgi:hypothetical protein